MMELLVERFIVGTKKTKQRARLLRNTFVLPAIQYSITFQLTRLQTGANEVSLHLFFPDINLRENSINRHCESKSGVSLFCTASTLSDSRLELNQMFSYG